MDSDPAAAHQTRPFCPHVGSWEDSTVHYLLPGGGNACHAGESPSRVERHHQEAFCLTPAWARCPRYLDSLSPKADKRAGRPARRRGRAWRALGVSALALVGLLAALLVCYLFVWPRVGAAGRFPPGMALAVVSASPTDAPEAIPQTPAAATYTTAPPDLPAAEAPTATKLPPTPTATGTGTPTPLALPTTTRDRPTTTATPLPASPTSAPPSPSPTVTATPEPTRARRPSPTPTLLPPPRLVSPLDGQLFDRWEVVTLAWQAVGTLPSNAYYVPTVTYKHHGATWTDETPWTKALSWTLSEHEYLQFLTDDGVFTWSVQVMRQTGTDPVTKKPVGVPLSRRSATRVVKWGAAQLQPANAAAPP